MHHIQACLAGFHSEAHGAGDNLDIETGEGEETNRIALVIFFFLFQIEYRPNGNRYAIYHLFWGISDVVGQICHTKLVFGCRRLDFTSCALSSEKPMWATYCDGKGQSIQARYYTLNSETLSTMASLTLAM